MWLYLPILLVFGGGLVLVFALDWVWSIDSKSEEFERDENGVPIRTPEWDRNHRLAGIVMLVTAVVLAVVVYFVG